MVLIGHRASGIGHRASGIGHRDLLAHQVVSGQHTFQFLLSNSSPVPFIISFSIYLLTISVLLPQQLTKATLFYAKQSLLSRWLIKLVITSPLLSCLLLLLLVDTVLINLAYGLTTQTAQVINGKGPYLSFDNGKTESNTVLPLLSLTLPNNKVILASEDNSSMTNPILMDGGSVTFNDIKTSIPFTSYPSTTLANVIVKNNYWRDEDGDKLLTITGNLKVKWETANGDDVTNYVKSNPNYQLNACQSPYKMTMSADSGSLVTTFGLPSISIFSGGSHSYYLDYNVPKACFAKPSVINGSGFFAGPSEQWDPTNGFKLQDLNQPESNFPTTGSNGLNFSLMVEGISAQAVISANGSVVKPEAGVGVTLQLTPKSSNLIDVTLIGPNKDSASKWFSPTTFKIYADNKKLLLLYSFKISRWFIADPSGASGLGQVDSDYDKTKSFCNGLLYYRIPSVRDYTNGNGNDWYGGLPNFTYLDYQRRISYKDSSAKWVGGIFSEWGMTYTDEGEYAASDWRYWHGYWTSDIYSDGNPFYVDPSLVGGGSGVSHKFPQSYINIRAACVNNY